MIEDVTKKYQGLFNLMSKEHNLILTISDMDEIIRESQNVVNKISSNAPVIKSVCECKTYKSYYQDRSTGRLLFFNCNKEKQTCL
jgi:hypothetical protein